jgi:MFS family permease
MDVPASSPQFSRRMSTFEIRSADGGLVWTWIAWAFAVYWVLFVAGAFLGQKQLNSLGGVIILCVLGWAALERLWVRVDSVFVASLGAAFIPLLHMFGSRTPESSEALVKYLSLCAVMALSRIVRLPVASSSKMRWPLAAQTLAILLISLTIYRGGAWDGGTRHSGLFPNPNNLALIPFLLLFFIDRTRDRLAIRVAVHAVVVLVLAFSGTSGAALAYAIGLTLHLSSALSRSWRLLACLLALMGGLIAVSLVALGGDKLLPETRLTNQLSVMHTEFQNVIQGNDIAYYKQERVLGSGSASAVWRLAHWRRTFLVYAQGTAFQIIFGFGPGSSTATLGILPHNEYLRILFEHGIAGFALFLFAWYRMIRSAPSEIRYIGLIFAIYSFSENNLDNFPFMSLFILCLSANPTVNSLAGRISRRIAPAWTAAAQRA